MMADSDRLQQMYEDQRAELGFRRSREQQVFAWTSAALLAIIGGVLASPNVSDALTRFGLVGKIDAALLVVVMVGYSANWQREQRRLMRRHQWVLAQLAMKRGWFSERDADDKTSLYPDEWKRWGSQNGAGPLGGKFWATILLGIVAAVVVLCAGA